ncbi:MAG: four helix bundle protein [Ignavibacteria bacterium]|jgi:four helix bundle protein|nr:four helix bundle protein [Ignavibacteria bacterium]
MLNLSHKRLEVWSLSIEVIKFIYKITEEFPKSEIYGISSQMRRASVSVSSNLAEGCSRKSSKEKKRFFEISRSSLVELDTQIEISKQLNYLDKNYLDYLDELFNKLFAKITNLILKTK